MIGLTILTVTLLRHIEVEAEPEVPSESLQPVHPPTVPVQPDICFVD